MYGEGPTEVARPSRFSRFDFLVGVVLPLISFERQAAAGSVGPLGRATIADVLVLFALSWMLFTTYWRVRWAAVAYSLAIALSWLVALDAPGTVENHVAAIALLMALGYYLYGRAVAGRSTRLRRLSPAISSVGSS